MSHHSIIVLDPDTLDDLALDDVELRREGRGSACVITYGDDLAARIETARVHAPLVVVVDHSPTADHLVASLDAGADDYVELGAESDPVVAAARLRTKVRRGGGDAHRIRAGRISIDTRTRQVYLGERVVALAPKEYELLEYMALRPGQVLSRAELLGAVWGATNSGEATVTEHVHRLRERLETDAKNPVHLQTVFGTGYRFERRLRPRD